MTARHQWTFRAFAGITLVAVAAGAANAQHPGRAGGRAAPPVSSPRTQVQMSAPLRANFTTNPMLSQPLPQSLSLTNPGSTVLLPQASTLSGVPTSGLYSSLVTPLSPTLSSPLSQSLVVPLSPQLSSPLYPSLISPLHPSLTSTTPPSLSGVNVFFPSVNGFSANGFAVTGTPVTIPSSTPLSVNGIQFFNTSGFGFPSSRR